ncbi:fructose-bisphosphate aldolase class II [Pseudovibrio sp. JE062]|nr:fructose-bisphosphate aldolase class II [Pseudovibrio sp. JE062]
MGKLKPGVIFGEDYKTLIEACREGKFALPAVNVVGTDSINAVLEAAAANNTDIIIQLSNGGAQFYAGKGIKDSFQAKVLGAVSAAQHVHLLAEHYGVGVVLHTDHADKSLIPWLEELIKHGEEFYKTHGKPLFTSHMLDLSAEDIEFNLSEASAC